MIWFRWAERRADARRALCGNATLSQIKRGAGLAPAAQGRQPKSIRPLRGDREGPFV